MQKDNVRAFKNELRNYRYYVDEVNRIGESIEEIYDRLGGVRGIDPSKEPLHTMPDKDMEYMLRDKITSLEAKKHRLEGEIKRIDRILEKMETSLRNAVKVVFIDGNTIWSVSYKMNLSPTGLKKRMNRAIEKALET